VATGIAGALLVSANERWKSRTDKVRHQLEAAGVVRGAAYSDGAIEGLPLPVQRYFRAVLEEGQPLITHARVVSSGTFNLGEPPESDWKPFTATQDFYPAAPGFVWDARVRMAPGLSAFVRDSFAGGQGSTFAAVLGLVTVANSLGTPGIAAAALMRYVAEMPWFPTTMLPGQGVIWTPLAGNAARAMFTASATTVSVDFSFGEDGLISGCAALRDNDKFGSTLPWGGRYMDGSTAVD
jgi:hypothetical protein